MKHPNNQIPFTMTHRFVVFGELLKSKTESIPESRLVLPPRSFCSHRLFTTFFGDFYFWKYPKFQFGTDFVGSIFWKPEEERHERKCWKSAVFLLITWRIIISRRVRRLVIMDKDATCLNRLIQYPFESRSTWDLQAPQVIISCSGLLAAASKDWLAFWNELGRKNSQNFHLAL